MVVPAISSIQLAALLNYCCDYPKNQKDEYAGQKELLEVSMIAPARAVPGAHQPGGHHPKG
ncbi:MAG: hypothetical protein SGJ27_08990 [Candidatus Melainabacteria bacterium]|nr:hypothetical protein [Candidatus Melainabacteria bacterium]